MKMMINNIINEIPLFEGKSFYINEQIYHNDNFPACFKVNCDGINYKVRFPSQFNSNSVSSEIEALSILTRHNVSNIPKIISYGKTVNSDVPYLVETFHLGESLDKIHKILTQDDWECISKQLIEFIVSIQKIRNCKFRTFDTQPNQYENYGTMLSYRIEKHLLNHESSGLLSNALCKTIRQSLVGIEKNFCHEPIFLHFDIKPQNIIYNTTNKGVTIIDYEHSRFGDISHEMFRGHIAAKKNLYFYDCWTSIYNTLATNKAMIITNEKQFFYQIFFYVSELSYANNIKDKELISIYEKGLVSHINNY